MFQLDQNTRIKEVLVIVLLLFFFCILKIFYIQVIEYDKLKNLANSLWTRELPVSADRGRILDRNGLVIAQTITTSSLILIPSQITDKESVARDISKILGCTYEEMYKHVSKRTSIERVHPIGRNLSFEVADKINELGYDGVYLVKESKRSYPYGNLLSHVIGYVGIDNQGLSGIELLYDKYLTGKDGAIKYYSDGKGHKLEIAEYYEPSVSGNDVYLTIDLNLQLALERELTNATTKYSPEQMIGIVMDTKTGEVLALANRPDFNPSNYQKYSTEVINRNLSIWSNYEPGSTFKIVTLAASIEEGTVDIFKDTFYDTGSIRVSGSRIGCWKTKGHGHQTFLQVVENSCNPGFVVLGQKLGKERLFNYIHKFGFGQKTGIDLNGESTGILFNLDKVGPVELATTAFGQGISVTPIQQVTAVSAIINDGNMYTPYIVSKVGKNKEMVIENKPKLKASNLIKKETSKLVRYALENVVAHGSGRYAYIENHRVGGKTGTAQKAVNGSYLVNNFILSFIGFLPADDPKYIVYIAIDNPKGVVQYGGTIAGPIAKNVMKEIINIYDIEESPKGIDREYNWYETKYIILPNVIGESVKNAKKKLSNFKIEYSGKGEYVVDMSPKSGSKIKEGSTVKLLLN